MSYTVQQIPLAPITGVHEGTGTHQATIWSVDPTTVPGSGPMAFTGYSGEVTTMLFAISDNVVPNWFGVAVPHGLSDFTCPHIFFHPTPAQAGYVDGDYPTKAGKWPELFYYMERLGYQLDGAHRNQVLIMPFMTEGAHGGGVLPANWQVIVEQILTQVRDAIDPTDTTVLSISKLVVSSYSAGMIYSDSFRRTGAGLSASLAEVWDFDGLASSFSAISQALHSTAGVEVIKYDQVASANTSAYHVPVGRWRQLPNPPTSFLDVHALIRDFMFLDAASVSQIGGLIDQGPAPTTGTHTATHAISATHTGTLSWGTHTSSASAAGTHTNTGSATHSGTATHSATAAQTGTGRHSVMVAGSGTAPHAGTIGNGTATATFGDDAPAPQPPPPPPPRVAPPTVPFAPASVPFAQPPAADDQPLDFQPPDLGAFSAKPATYSCAPVAPAIVAACAANSQTAITAITAIAKLG